MVFKLVERAPSRWGAITVAQLEQAAFLGSMLDATRADNNAAYQARQAGQRREADLHAVPFG
ncbi:hypothetical protein [Streptomyces sp. MBT84]|uniref:hypothetical protein n=1 Tax=Streptomyces sp. MBT84 TaxID=1488414 RepID=UPI0020766DEB|nr:hypothetical protein [Streptomyces sp. MBT84]